MSHNLTELNTYPSTVTVPDDGDARNAASVNGAFQALADRARLTRELLPDASMQLPGVTPDAYYDGTNLVVCEFTTVTGGTSFGRAYAGETTVTLPSLSASTWYYVYAYNSGTTSTPVTSFEVSTVVPDISRRFKTGYMTHRYLFAFVTNGSAVPRKFRKTRNQYLYRDFAFTGGYVYLTTSATSATVDCSSLVPPVPPCAFIDLITLVQNNDTAGPNAVLELRSHGDSNDGDFLVCPREATGGASGVAMARSVIQATAQSFDFAFTTAPGSFSLSFYVRGWRE